MPQHLSDDDKICPNPNCDKIVIHAEARMMEECPNNVTLQERWVRKTVIGRTYYHEDGTLCDQALYSVKPLRHPTFLRLGDPTRDPRN